MIYRIDRDAIIIVDDFSKKMLNIPWSVVESNRGRPSKYDEMGKAMTFGKKLI